MQIKNKKNIIKKLPLEMQKEAENYIEYLFSKDRAAKKIKKNRPYALCRGEFEIADDFNAQLSDDILKNWGLM